MTLQDQNYLKHIQDAIAQIEEYASDLNYENFLEDYLIQDGFIRQLEIIGDASKRLSKKNKNLTQNIPWKDISGMN